MAADQTRIYEKQASFRSSFVEHFSQRKDNGTGEALVYGTVTANNTVSSYESRFGHLVVAAGSWHHDVHLLGAHF
jgi:hypothetical protein